MLRRQPIIAAGVAVLLILAGCTAGSPSTGTSAGTENRTIHVTGTGSAEAEPNQAVVRVAAVATADDAATARRRLAENTTRMRTALEEIGIGDDQIVTRRYDIRRINRPREEGAEGDAEPRYRASHAFEITLSRIDRVGTVIDTAIGNGATEVDAVEFTLSTDRRQRLQREARRAAMDDARETARGLAGSANLTVTGVKVVRTGSDGGPRPVEDAYAGAPTATAGAATDVESGPVTVVTTVRVVYTAAPAEGATA